MTFDECWASLISLQGAVFHTTRGMPFTYSIHGGVIRIDRKANPITKATVEIAYNNAEVSKGDVPGSKALHCFGSSYLYPVFQEIGIIRKGEKAMPRTKGARNKAKLSLEERITAAESRVAAAREELAAAEEELRTLTALRDEAQVKELVDTIAASGKSIADVINLIRGGEDAPTEE